MLAPSITPTIRTERLLPRPFGPGDAGGLAAHRLDTEFARYMPRSPWASDFQYALLQSD